VPAEVKNSDSLQRAICFSHTKNSPCPLSGNFTTMLLKEQAGLRRAAREGFLARIAPPLAPGSAEMARS
jgi:hypothetical protein